jgi:hypothetical protein
MQVSGTSTTLDTDSEETPSIAPTDRYDISSDKRQKTELRQWLKDNQSDPALQVSYLLFRVRVTTYKFRILFLASKTTSYHDCLV